MQEQERATTDDETRRAITVCYFFASLLVDEPVWHLICSHYGLKGVSMAKFEKLHGKAKSTKEEYELYELRKEKATNKLYHLVEYMMCEVRRLLYSPERRVAGDVLPWANKCRNMIWVWRKRIIQTRNL